MIFSPATALDAEIIGFSTSRGIGLEFTRQLSLDPVNVVIATARNPEKASELTALGESGNGSRDAPSSSVGRPNVIGSLNRRAMTSACGRMGASSDCEGLPQIVCGCNLALAIAPDC